MRRIRFPLIPLLTLLLLATPDRPAAEELSLWELGVGIAALSWPTYPGVDRRTQWALPFPYIVYRGDFLRVDGDDVRGLIFDTDRIELDFSGGGSPRVRSDDVPQRRGMPDLDISFELGPSLRFNLFRDARHRIFAELNLRGLFSVDFPRMRYQGLLFNPALQWERQLGPRSEFGINLNWRYADSDYHDYFYGVDPRFATAQRPAYAGERGYNGTHLAVFGDFRPNRNWNLRAALGYRSLHGAAFDDSPLVNRNHGVYLNLVVSHIFLRSSQSAAPAQGSQ